MAPTKPTKPARAGQPTWAFDTGAPPRRRRSPRSRHPLAPRWPTLRRWRPPRPSMATRAHARAQDEKRPARGRGAEKRYRSGGERRDRAHPMPSMRRLADAGADWGPRRRDRAVLWRVWICSKKSAPWGRRGGGWRRRNGTGPRWIYTGRSSRVSHLGGQM